MTGKEYSRQPRQGEQTLGQSQAAARGFAPLNTLSNVTFVSSDVFAQGLSRLEQILGRLPLQLKSEGTYFIALEDGQLHLYSSKGDIEFELLENGTKVKRVGHRAGDTEIVLEIDGEPFVVTLHSEPYGRSTASQKHLRAVKKVLEDAGESTSMRTTSPWRSDYFRERQTSSSESAGGRSGEG